MNKRIPLVIIALQVLIWVQAQVPSNPIGNNPPSLRWNQINTDTIQVIFPSGLEDKGQEVANLVHFFWKNKDVTIGAKYEKFTILMQPQPIRGNGFVTVGPFRSEFFPIPRQFRPSPNFLNLLTIHEFRHVQQFSNGTQGITKLVRSVLGSWAWGGMLSMALPRWYFEGDAVIAETKFSQGGRGRYGPFKMEYDALFLSGKSYNFEKAAAGSLKDYVPDWYNLGYHMLTFGQREFGEDIWVKVAGDAVKFKGILFPFSRNLKKKTGFNNQMLYDATMADLKIEWENRNKLKVPDEAQVINSNDKFTVEHYSNPHFLDSQRIIAEKSSYEEISSFILIDEDGTEKKITEPGILTQGTLGTLSVGNTTLCWTSISHDSRWLNRQYSDIYTYHIAKDTREKITNRGRYFSPAITEDDSSIVAVEIQENLNQSLVVISAEDGSISERYQSDNYSTYQFPSWTDDQQIIAVATSGQTNQLVKVNRDNGLFYPMMEPTSRSISHPVEASGKIYFSWDISGTSNIYELDIESGRIFQLTNSLVGAFQPDLSENGEWMIYSEFHSSGFNIRKISLREIAKIEVDLIFKQDESYPEDDEKVVEKMLDASLKDTFQVKKFNKWSGILNPHSLLADFQYPYISMRVLTDNKFGTLSGQAGAFYNYNESEWSYQVNLSYAELFPVIHTGFVHANRSGIFLNYAALNESSYTRTVSRQAWSEDRLSAGVSVPLHFTWRNSIANLSWAAQYRRINLNVQNNGLSPGTQVIDTLTFEENRASIESIYADPIFSTSFHSMDLAFNFSVIRRMARLNVRPKSGVTFGVRFRSNLNEPLLGGNVWSGQLSWYLPGFAKNHSLLLEAGYQKERMLDNYRFSDNYRYSRGYELSLRRDEYFRGGINYMFPLLYPDKAIGPLAFIKRVKANLFYDHGIVKIKNQGLVPLTENMRSAGVELNVDFRAFRLLEVDWGVRYSYLLDKRFILGDRRHVIEFFVVSITQ